MYHFLLVRFLNTYFKLFYSVKKMAVKGAKVCEEPLEHLTWKRGCAGNLHAPCLCPIEKLPERYPVKLKMQNMAQLCQNLSEQKEDLRCD